MSISDPVATAILSASVSLLVAIFTTLFAERRMRQEYKLDFAAEYVARRLLKHPDWKWRSFETIKHHLGGFEDDELRRILVRAGAIRSVDRSKDVEVWGLVQRVNISTKRRRDTVAAISRSQRVDKPFEVTPQLYGFSPMDYDFEVGRWEHKSWSRQVFQRIIDPDAAWKDDFPFGCLYAVLAASVAVIIGWFIF